MENQTRCLRQHYGFSCLIGQGARTSSCKINGIKKVFINFEGLFYWEELSESGVEWSQETEKK